MLPDRGWATYEQTLKGLGEQRTLSDDEDLPFLRSLCLVEAENQKLTAAGAQFFHLRFIEENEEAALEVLRHQVLTSCPEGGAICQLLSNRPKIPRSLAETVLRSQGHGKGLTNRGVGSLLSLMGRTGVIDYDKRNGSFRVVAKPLAEPKLPNSIFIDPDTPWSNRAWLRRILDQCEGFIYWLDKHFLPEGLDFIGAAADGARINEVRIVSLELDVNQTRKAKRAYRDLARELRGRGIIFEWRFIDSKELRDTHDRWIISDDQAWNVPPCNAILSGQRSELTTSGNRAELQLVFEEVWEKATPHPAAQVDQAA